MLKTIIGIFIACIICCCTLSAQSSVSLIVNTQHPGAAIADNFSGLSLEMGALKYGNGSTTDHMFDDTTRYPVTQHSQVLTIFNELGLKNIRVGGGSVDEGIAPADSDIDAFFRFVKEANVDVIYSVQLLNGSISTDSTIVKYVYNNYGQYIYCFSIGNEPDWHSYHTSDPLIYETTSGNPGTAYPSYLTDWRNFAAAISTAVPDAKFGGPDTGSNYPVPSATNTYYNSKSWTLNFADDEHSSVIVKSIFLHNYVGQSASGTSSSMISSMLSAAWDTTYYPDLYNASCSPVAALGLPFRLTESNSFSGYLAGASTSFATALFSLDYLHWWAAHGAAGVNFHNKQWVGNGPIYMDASKNFQIYPLGYGIKAFDLGGHGDVDSVAMTNAGKINVTAYAVQDTDALYVTVINKTYGSSANNVKVNIIASGYSGGASVMFLKSTGGVTDTTDVTLGGAAVTNSGWSGSWSSVDSVRSDSVYLTVPSSNAAIVKIEPDAPTPVELTSFTSSLNPSGVELEWTTATEINNNGFNVQRRGMSGSLNAFWTSIGFVKGSGVSNSTKHYSFLDANSLNGNCQYRLQQIDNDGSFKYSMIITVSNASSPSGYQLGSYPNPFNPSTTIRFQLPEDTFVDITVYNILGEKVATLVHQPMGKGTHEVMFSNANLASGIYIYRLKTNDAILTQKMMLLK